jgi:hypothetical protein
MNVSDSSLQDAFVTLADLADDGRRCPDAEMLWKSARGELEPEEAEALLIHLGECGACAMTWRVTRDMADGDVAAPSTTREFSPTRWFPLAMAATVLVTVSVVGIWIGSGERQVEPVYRAPQSEWLQPVFPDGERLARDEFVLRWTPGPEGTTYAVHVTSEELEPLASALKLDEAEFRVPAEALTDLASGSRVFWQVTASLPDGRRADSESFTAVID